MGRYLITLAVLLICLSTKANSNTLDVYIEISETGAASIHLGLRYRAPPKLLEELEKSDIHFSKINSQWWTYTAEYPAGMGFEIPGVLVVTAYSPHLYSIDITNYISEIEDGSVCLNLPVTANVLQHNAETEPSQIYEVCYGFEFNSHQAGWALFQLWDYER